MTSKTLFVVQQKIIHDLMGDEWFSRHKLRIENHPAYKISEICEKIISQDGQLRLPEDESLIPHFMSSFLDVFDIVRCSGTEIDKFKIDSLVLSDFKAYGDEQVHSRIRNTVQDPGIFVSLLTELTFSAWCFSKEFKVEPYEKEGYPDFKLLEGKMELPILVDCKKLAKGTILEKRVPKVIKHANKQIKKVLGDHFGVVFIDASSVVRFPKKLSDEIPKEVLEIGEYIKSSVSNLNTAVSAVLLSWDDYSVLGDPSKDKMQTYVLRRRSRLIHHKSPHFILPENSIIKEYGATFSMNLNLTPRFVNIEYTRNGKCKCGSGKRYKHCHGRLTP